MVHTALRQCKFKIVSPGTKKLYNPLKRVSVGYEDACQFIEQGFNVGVDLSQSPLLVVDIDNNDADNLFASKNPPKSLIESTRRGYHIYYQIPPQITHYKAYTYTKSRLELKCGSGSTLVAPSTVENIPYNVIVSVEQLSVAPPWILGKVVFTPAPYLPAKEAVEMSQDALEALLSTIQDDGTYEMHRNVGMALNNLSAGEEWGFELWLSWTEQDGRSHRKPHTMKQQWERFSAYEGHRFGISKLREYRS